MKKTVIEQGEGAFKKKIAKKTNKQTNGRGKTKQYT